MNFVHDKSTICETVVPILQEKNIDISVNRAMKTWWRNPRKSGGLELTDRGHNSFEFANLEHYNVEYCFDDYSARFNILFTLNKKLSCPYYIQNRKKIMNIKIYDSRIYVLINLYGGIQDYLNTIGD